MPRGSKTSKDKAEEGETSGAVNSERSRSRSRSGSRAKESGDGKETSGNRIQILSWNVGGLRAFLKKDGLKSLREQNPDIICLQETKCSKVKLPPEVKNMTGYSYIYWNNPTNKEGYSGVGLLSKLKPIEVTYNLGLPEHDNEGRLIVAEFEDFYLINVYVPNSGRGLVRLEYRQKWDMDLRAYLKKLDTMKPVIVTGDLNVSHQEIDLANPKTNQRTAGFTREERDGFSLLLEEGFFDSFRELHPDEKGAYTFWTYMAKSRSRNVGWRLDYFLLSEKLRDKLAKSEIRSKLMGSDHCPIVLTLEM